MLYLKFFISVKTFIKIRVLILLPMIGKCDQCGLESVEVKRMKKPNSQEETTLCNQCRPVDGAYAY
jgi:hypothetical protein